MVEGGWRCRGVPRQDFAGESQRAEAIPSIGHDLDIKDRLVFHSFDPFKLKTSHGEQVADALRRELGFDKARQQGDGELHALFILTETTEPDAIGVT